MSTPASQSPLPITPESLREILTDAFRYWELRRIPYNAMLLLVVVYAAVRNWALIKGALHWVDILPLFVLAVLANVCYSAAYIADVPIQLSGFQNSWRKWRWVLWVIGTVFAATLALYWMGDEIMPGIIGN